MGCNANFRFRPFSQINASTIEVQIASNSPHNKVEFYIADSGWKEGAVWLNEHPSSPIYRNIIGSIFRNYGNGDTDVLNNDFPDGNQDSPHDVTNNAMSYNAIPCWFNVTHLFDETEIEPGTAKTINAIFTV